MDPRRSGYWILVLVLMLIAAGLGYQCGKRPSVPRFIPPVEPPPQPPVKTAVPEKRIAIRKPGLAAPKLLNLGDLQANIRKYYPEAEHKAGKEGRVMLAMDIAADGSVSKVHVETSGGADFDEAAIKVARAMHFSPARRAGAPVAVEISEGIDFQFDGASKTGP